MQQLLLGENAMDTGTGGRFDTLAADTLVINRGRQCVNMNILSRDLVSSPKLEIRCVVSESVAWLSTLVIFRRLTFGCSSTSPICAIRSNFLLSIFGQDLTVPFHSSTDLLFLEPTSSMSMPKMSST